jgi:N6-L-threonylcarbamoyladenine synthase
MQATRPGSAASSALRVLAIETSCDETAVAVMDGPSQLVATQVWSQAASHAPFGGVVPEIASRQHGEVLPNLVRGVLVAADIPVDSIHAVAATTGPGLPTALLVGTAYAKGLSIGLRCPFLGVNHVEGHLLSPFFGEEVIPPHIGLVVSGGHTLLIDVQGVADYRILGTTLDDAAGEAFDKVAKLLGLGYPGGVEIDRLARDGDPQRFDLPRSMLYSGDRDFSFSGLKTAVRNLRDKIPGASISDICASFQEAVVDVLVGKVLEAASATGHQTVAVSGGVSSNSRLQTVMEQKSAKAGIILRLARSELRTDNASMIAFVAAHHLQLGRSSPLSMDVDPTFQRRKFEHFAAV